MGTDRAHVEITAATLAGGEKNQDRYAYGDGWAFVLDGASSFATTQPEHDGGWYAERLKRSLTTELEAHPDRSTAAIVKDAIRVVAEEHGGDAASCPTSTIALARWDDERVEVYLLGDSTAVLISDHGEEVFADTRLAEIAGPIRDKYRSRLSDGHGFDERHRELLQQLQFEQAAARNLAEGYWIAGADPEAAQRGLTYTRELRPLRAIILASDGAAAGIRYGIASNWAEFLIRAPDEVLRKTQKAELRDNIAKRWPRSKRHDDKTCVCIASRHLR